jgi:hypothetical protein
LGGSSSVRIDATNTSDLQFYADLAEALEKTSWENIILQGSLNGNTYEECITNYGTSFSRSEGKYTVVITANESGYFIDLPSEAYHTLQDIETYLSTEKNTSLKKFKSNSENPNSPSRFVEFPLTERDTIAEGFVYGVNNVQYALYSSNGTKLNFIVDPDTLEIVDVVDTGTVNIDFSNYIPLTMEQARTFIGATAHSQSGDDK